MSLIKDERERFSRQMLHPGFTERHQERLRESTVVLAGVGGLGGAIAYGLAGAGVGRLVLVHEGELDEADLNRQTLMSESAVGMSRVGTAAKRLSRFCGHIGVEAYDIPVREETLDVLVNGVDLVIDARHNFSERRTLNRVAIKRGIPLLFAAMDGLEAQMALFKPEVTGCLDCLYPEDPPDWDPYGFPVFGAVAHAIGAMAAMEAVKYLSGYGKTSGRLLAMDMGDYSTRTFDLRPDTACPTCGSAPEVLLKKPSSQCAPDTMPQSDKTFHIWHDAP